MIELPDENVASPSAGNGKHDTDGDGDCQHCHNHPGQCGKAAGEDRMAAFESPGDTRPLTPEEHADVVAMFTKYSNVPGVDAFNKVTLKPMSPDKLAEYKQVEARMVAAAEAASQWRALAWRLAFMGPKRTAEFDKNGDLDRAILLIDRMRLSSEIETDSANAAMDAFIKTLPDYPEFSDVFEKVQGHVDNDTGVVTLMFNPPRMFSHLDSAAQPA